MLIFIAGFAKVSSMLMSPSGTYERTYYRDDSSMGRAAVEKPEGVSSILIRDTVFRCLYSSARHVVNNFHMLMPCSPTCT